MGVGIKQYLLAMKAPRDKNQRREIRICDNRRMGKYGGNEFSISHKFYLLFKGKTGEKKNSCFFFFFFEAELNSKRKNNTYTT